jgi:hypothetical protein
MLIYMCSISSTGQLNFTPKHMEIFAVDSDEVILCRMRAQVEYQSDDFIPDQRAYSVTLSELMDCLTFSIHTSIQVELLDSSLKLSNGLEIQLEETDKTLNLDGIPPAAIIVNADRLLQKEMSRILESNKKAVKLICCNKQLSIDDIVVQTDTLTDQYVEVDVNPKYLAECLDLSSSLLYMTFIPNFPLVLQYETLDLTMAIAPIQ